MRSVSGSSTSLRTIRLLWWCSPCGVISIEKDEVRASSRSNVTLASSRARVRRCRGGSPSRIRRAARVSTIDIDLVRPGVPVRVLVGRRPQQHEARSSGQCNPAQGGIGDHLAVVAPKGRFDSARLLHEGRDQGGLGPQAILKIWPLGEGAGAEASRLVVDSPPAAMRMPVCPKASMSVSSPSATAWAQTPITLD